MSYESIDTSVSGSPYGSMASITTDIHCQQIDCHHCRRGMSPPCDIGIDITWIACSCGVIDAYIHRLNVFVPYASREKVQSLLLENGAFVFGGNLQYESQFTQPFPFTQVNYAYEMPPENHQQNGYMDMVPPVPPPEMYVEPMNDRTEERRDRDRGWRRSSFRERLPLKVKHCVFCRKNGEPQMLYRAHVLRVDGKVTCPVLRKYVCPVCKKTGDDAHTLKHCPDNVGESAIIGRHEISRTGRNARGILGTTYRYE